MTFHEYLTACVQEADSHVDHLEILKAGGADVDARFAAVTDRLAFLYAARQFYEEFERLQ